VLSFGSMVTKRSYPILAIDLLERLLKFDPAERISAAEALSHPYFTSAITPAPFGLNTSPGSMPPPAFNFPHPHGHQVQQQYHQQQQRSQPSLNPQHGHAPQYARPVYNQHMPPQSMAYPPDPAVNMGQSQYTGVQFAAPAAPAYNHPPR
jgi:negative regulator of PHO system